MRIAIIAQCIYPTQTPRSFRAFELAKQLAKDHEVTLYALLGNYDYSQIEHETGLKIRNIGVSRCGLYDSDGCHRRTLWWGGIHVLFGGLLQMPQMELVPMVKRLAMEISKDVDMIISVAVPYAIHWGIAFAKRKCEEFPLWISDCGDPFMGNPVTRPPLYFKRMELFWGRQTDYITVPIEDAKNAYFPEFRNKIRVIPQGFNIESTDIGSYQKNEVPRFVFAGNFILGKRDPKKFIEYLATLKSDFRFVLYTRGTEYVEQFRPLLKEKIEIHDFIPRNELLKVLGTSDFLINISNVGTVQSPSKLIDYAIAKRPILQISTDFPDIEKQTFEQFLMGDYSNALPTIDIAQYDIRNVAKNFLELYYLNN